MSVLSRRPRYPAEQRVLYFVVWHRLHHSADQCKDFSRYSGKQTRTRVLVVRLLWRGGRGKRAVQGRRVVSLSVPVLVFLGYSSTVLGPPAAHFFVKTLPSVEHAPHVYPPPPKPVRK